VPAKDEITEFLRTEFPQNTCLVEDIGDRSATVVQPIDDSHLLRRPASDRSIVAVSSLIKVGRSLIVGEVSLYSRGKADMVAHAVGTYSVPPSSGTSKR